MSTPYVTIAPYEGVERRLSEKRISWAAVFAGATMVLALQVLMTMLGTGIGMGTVNPIEGSTPSAGALGLGAGVWWIVSSLIALLAGGWAAGYLSGKPIKMEGALHGLLTWAVSTLVMLYLLSSAIGSVVGGAFSMLGATVTAAAPQVTESVARKIQSSDLSWDKIRSEAMQMISKRPNAATAHPELEGALSRLLTGAQPTQADREAAVKALMSDGAMTRPEAQRAVENWEQQYRATVQDVKQTTQVAAQSVSRTALMGFFSLLLGAAAGAWGGAFGAPRRLVRTLK